MIHLYIGNRSRKICLPEMHSAFEVKCHPKVQCWICLFLKRIRGILSCINNETLEKGLSFTKFQDFYRFLDCSFDEQLSHECYFLKLRNFKSLEVLFSSANLVLLRNSVRIRNIFFYSFYGVPITWVVIGNRTPTFWPRWYYLSIVRLRKSVAAGITFSVPDKKQF